MQKMAPDGGQVRLNSMSPTSPLTRLSKVRGHNLSSHMEAVSKPPNSRYNISDIHEPHQRTSSPSVKLGKALSIMILLLCMVSHGEANESLIKHAPNVVPFPSKKNKRKN